MSFVVTPSQLPVIPIKDERNLFFPVRRVYCIARNYQATRQALNTQAGQTPFFFMKPADAIVPVADAQVLHWPTPSMSQNVQPELELVACLGAGGRNLTREDAQAAIYGWCVGFDMTRRDLQQQSSQEGRPWDVAKAFDASAPVTHVMPAYRTPLPAPCDIWCYLNNQKVQSGRTDQMILDPFDIIVELSRYWTLSVGDVIFTGTPAGVTPIEVGDELKGGVNGVGTLSLKVVPSLT